MFKNQLQVLPNLHIFPPYFDFYLNQINEFNSCIAEGDLGQAFVNRTSLSDFEPATYQDRWVWHSDLNRSTIT